MSQALRERLHAQKALKEQKEAQTQAKKSESLEAVRTLVDLGYNFKDILALANNEISSLFLHQKFKELGYNSSTDAPLNSIDSNFGKPRWIRNLQEFQITEDSDQETEITQTEPLRLVTPTVVNQTENRPVGFEMPSFKPVIDVDSLSDVEDYDENFDIENDFPVKSYTPNSLLETQKWLQNMPDSIDYVEPDELEQSEGQPQQPQQPEEHTQQPEEHIIGLPVSKNLDNIATLNIINRRIPPIKKPVVTDRVTKQSNSEHDSIKNSKKLQELLDEKKARIPVVMKSVQFEQSPLTNIESVYDQIPTSSDSADLTNELVEFPDENMSLYEQIVSKQFSLVFNIHLCLLLREAEIVHNGISTVEVPHFDPFFAISIGQEVCTQGEPSNGVQETSLFVHSDVDSDSDNDSDSNSVDVDNDRDMPDHDPGFWFFPPTVARNAEELTQNLETVLEWFSNNEIPVPEFPHDKNYPIWKSYNEKINELHAQYFDAFCKQIRPRRKQLGNGIMKPVDALGRVINTSNVPRDPNRHVTFDVPDSLPSDLGDVNKHVETMKTIDDPIEDPMEETMERFEDPMEPTESMEEPIEENMESIKNIIVDPENETKIQAELEKVRLEVKRIEERKRETEITNKKRAGLQKIAAKRASLAAGKPRQDISEISAKITQLEEALKNEKEKMLAAAAKLKEIKEAELQLDEEEKLVLAEEKQSRDALRTAIKSADESSSSSVSDHSDQSQPNGNARSDAHSDAHHETDMDMDFKSPFGLPQRQKDDSVRYSVRTSTPFYRSPLDAFPESRFKRNADVFNISYNSMFVPNLANRTLCNAEVSGSKCTNKKCKMVHYSEFEVDNHTVLKYHAERDLNDKNYKKFLLTELEKIRAMKPVISANELANNIAIIRQEYYGGFLKL